MLSNRKHLMLAGVFAAVLSTLSISSFAGSGEKCHGPARGEHASHRGHGGDGKGPQGAFWQHKMDKLKMTPEQQAQAKQIFEKQHAAQEKNREAMRETQQALYAASRTKDFDRSRVEQLANDQAKLRAQMTVARAEAMHQFFAVLTEEQKQQMQQWREKRKPADKAPTAS